MSAILTHSGWRKGLLDQNGEVICLKFPDPTNAMFLERQEQLIVMLITLWFLPTEKVYWLKLRLVRTVKGNSSVDG